jgi:heme/copper-type cytochrome/quinol oxidase subunit 2
MNIVDLLVTIVVVTILVTIVLAVVTYVAYKLRLAREPRRELEPEGHRYFVEYRPPVAAGTSSTLEHLDESVASLEGHAAEA